MVVWLAAAATIRRQSRRRDGVALLVPSTLDRVRGVAQPLFQRPVVHGYVLEAHEMQDEGREGAAVAATAVGGGPPRGIEPYVLQLGREVLGSLTTPGRSTR